jgi:putative ABC transport system substrate-binding protein
MNRRDLFMLAASAALSPLPAAAQQVAKPARLGYLAMDLAGADPSPMNTFLQALYNLGYAEGRNLVIEYRDAAGHPERFPTLAAELVALDVDIIVAAGGTLGALAAKRATIAIPIVFPVVGNPVGEGLVSSLARPGGNITGLSVVSTELIGKLFELLKEAVPGLSRIALLLKPDATPSDANELRLAEAQVAARALRVQLQIVEVKGPSDFDRAFAKISEGRADGLIVLATPVFDSARQRLLDLAAESRLPAIYSFKGYVEAGGLMSYGPSLDDNFRRAAAYVDKILKGAKPGDLPVEQPSKFELVINLKAVKALGITIPQSLLSRADDIIE